MAHRPTFKNRLATVWKGKAVTTIHLPVVNLIRPVEVSPTLTWANECGTWYAETGGGRYSVAVRAKQWRWLFYCGTKDDVPPTPASSAEVGKRECEKHWARFIRDKS